MKTNLLKNIGKLLSGSTLAQLISILSAPIVTHLFAPDVFGVLGLYISIATVPIMLSSLRYHLAIPLAKDSTEAHSVYSLSVSLTFFVSAICAYLVYAHGDAIASTLNSASLAEYLWLLPLSVLVRGIHLAVQFYCTREQKFAAISFSSVIDSALGAAISISIGLLYSASAAALISARVVAGFASLLSMSTIAYKQNMQLLLPRIKPSQLIEIASRYKKFPLISSWASILNTLAFILPVMVIAYYFSAEHVGLYTLADRVIILPLSMIGTAVAQVLYQRVCELNHNQQSFNLTVSVILDKLASISIFPMLCLTLIGAELFALVFGAEWYQAGRYAQILSVYGLFRFIIAPLTNISAAIEKQEIELVFNIVLCIGRVAAIVYGGIQGDIIIGLILMTGASVLAYTLLLVMILSQSTTIMVDCLKIILKQLLAAAPLLIIIFISRELYGYNTQGLVLFACGLLFLANLYICNKEYLSQPQNNDKPE